MGACSTMGEGPCWEHPPIGLPREGSLSIDSPCISLCRIDPETGTCEGCGRTLDEIRSWKAAEDDEKAEILERVAERREVV